MNTLNRSRAQQVARVVEIRAIESGTVDADAVPAALLRDAVREAGKILHFARRRELPAGQRPLEHQRVQIGPAGVDRGGEPGAGRPHQGRRRRQATRRPARRRASNVRGSPGRRCD